MRDFVVLENQGIQLSEECIRQINAVAARAAALEGVPDASANIVIADDDYLHELNWKFRQIDRATDVLSFPANELSAPIGQAIEAGADLEQGEEGELFLGDIFISLDHAAVQAEEYGNTLEQ